MIYQAESGDFYETTDRVVICINSNSSVTLHLGNGNTNNYISIEAFEDSIHKGYNLFVKPCLKSLLEEIGL